MKRDDSALVGPLAVMPLEELLQWLDQTGRTGVVYVERRDGLETWLAVQERELVYASPAPLEGSLRVGTQAQRTGAALEAVLDLFLGVAAGGRFRFEARAEVPAGGVPIGQPLAFALMDGLRVRDEWPRQETAFPDESAILRANGRAQTGHAVQDAILSAVREHVSLAAMRMRLGLSRPAALRRASELVDRGLLAVDGVKSRGPDPVATMLAQATTLLSEGQFAEAAHVFRTLLASDPLDARARQLLARTEQAEARTLSAQLPARAMLTRRKSASLPGHAGVVLDLVSDGRPVAFVVLASPLREVETLRVVAQLVKSGHLEARTTVVAAGARGAGPGSTKGTS